MIGYFPGVVNSTGQFSTQAVHVEVAAGSPRAWTHAGYASPAMADGGRRTLKHKTCGRRRRMMPALPFMPRQPIIQKPTNALARIKNKAMMHAYDVSFLFSLSVRLCRHHKSPVPRSCFAVSNPTAESARAGSGNRHSHISFFLF